MLDWMVTHHPSLGLDKRAEEFVKIFENHLDPQSLILDIGGGWGYYSEPLEKRGHAYVVLDVIRPALQHAPVILYGGEGRMPFPDKSFDVSLLITVLHHTPDPEYILREAIRVTRNKIIVIEDLYRHELGRFWTKLRDQLYNFEFIGHPANFHAAEEWKKVFQGLQLEVKDEQKIYTWLSGMRILNGIFVLEPQKIYDQSCCG